MSTRNVNFQAILQNIVQFVKSRAQGAPPGPCDGFILRLHYRVAFSFTLAGFLTVWYGWYFTRIIHCVGTFNSNDPAREDYQNICLSYPFVKEEGNKRYLLFYRWVHWTLLLLSVLFYAPRKISKSLENPKAKKIIEELAHMSPRYDPTAEKDALQRVFYYMMINIKTNNGLYYKYLGLNMFVLIIDIFILGFLDFLFHGRFSLLIPNSYPFKRNPDDFSDYISRTFPPFADCILNDHHKILNGREELIGCHLTIMELYEKIFFIFWLMLYSLIIATTVHILFLLLMLVPATWPYFLRPAKPVNTTKSVESISTKFSTSFRVGDVYFLHRVKHHINHARFYELLLRLEHPSIASPPPQPKVLSELPDYKEKIAQNNYLQDHIVSGDHQKLRNRNHTSSLRSSSRLNPEPQDTTSKIHLNTQRQGNLQSNQLQNMTHAMPPYHTHPISDPQNLMYPNQMHSHQLQNMPHNAQHNQVDSDTANISSSYHKLLARNGLSDTSILIN